MSELSTSSGIDRRKERRIRVRLPVEVRGTDRSGARFDDRTLSEDLCRQGAAFLLSRDIELGTDVELRIPLPGQKQRGKTDFATLARVRHIEMGKEGRVIGVQFIGSRFNRLFQSELATVD
jgi:hypothetical protein